MSGKKLFRAVIEFEVLVAAETSEEALGTLAENLSEITSQISSDDAFVTPLLLNTMKPVLPPGWEMNAIPWGSEDDQTVSQILESMKEAEPSG